MPGSQRKRYSYLKRNGLSHEKAVLESMKQLPSAPRKERKRQWSSTGTTLESQKGGVPKWRFGDDSKSNRPKQQPAVSKQLNLR